MNAETIFKQDYEKHLQHLALKGCQPKTIEAYSRAVRRIGDCFEVGSMRGTIYPLI